jgi:hypothetical protein
LREIGTTAHFTTIAKFAAVVEKAPYSTKYARNIHAALGRLTDVFVRPGGDGMFALKHAEASHTKSLPEEMTQILTEAKAHMSARTIYDRLPSASRYSFASVSMTAAIRTDLFQTTEMLGLISSRSEPPPPPNEYATRLVYNELTEHQGSTRQEVKNSLKGVITDDQIDSVLALDSHIVRVGSAYPQYVWLGRATDPRQFTKAGFVTFLMSLQPFSSVKEALDTIRMIYGISVRPQSLFI